ncbi:hypothetical protein ACH5RR_013783 [Cinchona calisaya]|uniref:Uncharacterized protein n=1 Tax=Cinchona calisaya TaxID=153742 RepID=A0ABD3A105_9GENT
MESGTRPIDKTLSKGDQFLVFGCNARLILLSCTPFRDHWTEQAFPSETLSAGRSTLTPGGTLVDVLYSEALFNIFEFKLVFLNFGVEKLLFHVGSTEVLFPYAADFELPKNVLV